MRNRHNGHDGAMLDPVWPEEIVLQTDLSPSAWILPRLLPNVLSGGDGTPVASIVPSGYPAYIRVFHPANGPSLTWRDVATSTGRTYHPLMQRQQISARGNNSDPPMGEIVPDVCRALYSALAEWTTTPDTCWLGIWEGYGSLYAPSSGHVSIVRPTTGHGTDDDGLVNMIADWERSAEVVRSVPRFEHPGRHYLLARTPCPAIWKLGRFPLGVAANLAWPDDHAWCVGTEIDFDSTIVGCSDECAAALLGDEALEALAVPPEGRLDIGGDVINPLPSNRL